jgi:SAM-dependent methyltransferase
MRSIVNMEVSHKLIIAIDKMASSAAGSIGGDLPEYYIEYYLNLLPHLIALVPLGEALNFDKATRVLEIGSGIGTRCLLGNAIWGSQFTGVEPCLNTYSPLLEAIVEFQKSNSSLSYVFLNTPGEKIGLYDNSFDYVISFDVLEHVQEPKKVISEVFRLLKPNGKFYFTTVNYFSFYEGHYRIPWIPGQKKDVASFWVKLFKRNPKFLNEINFISRQEILMDLRQAGFKNINMGHVYPAADLPSLVVNYPQDFSLPSLKNNKLALQVSIQRPCIQSLLSKFGMEYKIYVEATK